MDRILLMEQLASAMKHADESQMLIGRHRDRIYFLGKAGHDTTLAELVLARLEAAQTLRIADRRRLQELIATGAKP